MNNLCMLMHGWAGGQVGRSIIFPTSLFHPKFFQPYLSYPFFTATRVLAVIYATLVDVVKGMFEVL